MTWPPASPAGYPPVISLPLNADVTRQHRGSTIRARRTLAGEWQASIDGANVGVPCLLQVEALHFARCTINRRLGHTETEDNPLNTCIAGLPETDENALRDAISGWDQKGP